MKINISSIIRDHWATLYDARSNRTNYVDIGFFYVLPRAAAIAAYAFGFKLNPDSYNVSITFFGIFLALLLNIQVAIFAIFQRKWEPPSDARQADKQREALDNRRALLGELNSNISYLTVVSAIALVAFLIFFVAEWKEGMGPALSLALYIHFILTFLMIVKRSHALFQREYCDSPR
jgi:hypothetical protein